ncbi:GNAT family N-acetyltransferase [Granulicella sp. L46]|uniref:GNAT family N-acetyltransferase n=1 Tax=Granulicella sp. L46 TaxID=1641865 RepID=UPI00131B634F|nr:GNAT family N-acetyltransferase [Granulicella sp. L46]
MTTTLQLATPRLLLRPWQDRDRAPFATMNADPEVMRYFPTLMTQQETDDAADRYNQQLDRDGFTMFAVEDRTDQSFLGVLGAQTMRFEIPNLPQPAVEIGWRLASQAQGRGLATEGAHAIINHLRNETTIREVVAITTPDNLASQNVMRKLNMTVRPELTFDHPLIAADHPRRQHVLYNLDLSSPYAK